MNDITKTQSVWADNSNGQIRMLDRKIKRENVVIGPEGTPLTLADLPKPNTVRWVIRRKAEVVAAVRGGLLTLDGALDRYSLTAEEFMSWQRSIESHGIAGLRTTRVQQYR